MECKNCQRPLRTDYIFCSFCGAKIIQHRLTLKNLWFDITERYFNVDNTFFKTFVHLFSRPEVVIEGYIEGVRKKYLNPISYLAIALTLSGIMVFFLRKSFPDGLNFDVFGTGTYSPEVNKKLTDFTLTFYSFLFLLYVPMFAFSTWLAFNKKRYLFTEHIVSAIYTQAHYSLMSFILTLILLWQSPESYMEFSMISLVLNVFYMLYVWKRISNLRMKSFAFYSFIFIMLSGFCFMVISLVQMVLMLLNGTMTPEDFMPKT